MMTNTQIAKAIQTLRPNAIFSVSKGVVSWMDSTQTQPTEAEIEAEVNRANAEYAANEYQRKRAMAYPSIPDQLDQIFHEGLDAWKATIAEIKATYPKESL